MKTSKQLKRETCKINRIKTRSTTEVNGFDETSAPRCVTRVTRAEKRPLPRNPSPMSRSRAETFPRHPRRRSSKARRHVTRDRESNTAKPAPKRVSRQRNLQPSSGNVPDHVGPVPGRCNQGNVTEFRFGRLVRSLAGGCAVSRETWLETGAQFRVKVACGAHRLVTTVLEARTATFQSCQGARPRSIQEKVANSLTVSFN